MISASQFRSSLTGRLLFSLIFPAAICVGLLCFSGAVTIHRIVERLDDRVLNTVLQSVSDTISYADGRTSVALPPSVIALMKDGERTKVYYAVRVDGKLVSGDAGLPVSPFSARDEGRTLFVYSTYRGRQVRLASIARHLPQLPPQVVVQVAQTMERRNAFKWLMTSTLVFNGLLVIMALAVLLPFSVRWGLKPLAEVKHEIDSRRIDDIQPLKARDVPIEMRSILKAFNDMLLRLRGAVEEIRSFTANASHQMRTPLSILRAHLDVIRREGLDSAKGQASFADVETAVSRLQRLLTQLLALARAEDAKTEVAGLIERVDLVTIARDVAEASVPVALAAGIDLEFDARAPAIPIDTVETLAHELIANLVDNAIRYNHQGGSVRMILENSDGIATFVVEDDGPGIPEAEQDTIFERFRRLPRDHKQEGSGLGLAIVKTLADAIGATVGIASGIQGRGIRAEVRFDSPPIASGK